MVWRRTDNTHTVQLIYRYRLLIILDHQLGDLNKVPNSFVSILKTRQSLSAAGEFLFLEMELQLEATDLRKNIYISFDYFLPLPWLILVPAH